MTWTGGFPRLTSGIEVFLAGKGSFGTDDTRDAERSKHHRVLVSIFFAHDHHRVLVSIFFAHYTP